MCCRRGSCSFGSISYGTVTLQKKDDEKTVVRFTINSDGTVGNVNHIPKSLVNKAFKHG